MERIKDRGDGRIGFRVRIRPAAPRNKLLGWNTAGELRISINAPAREGKANRALVAFLADRFNLTKRDIRIESGERSRSKTMSAPSSVKDSLLALPDIESV